MSMKEIRTGDTVYILRGIVLRAENASEGKVVSVSGNEAVVSSEGQAYTFTVSAVVDPETSGKEYVMMCGSEAGIMRCFRSLDEIRALEQKCFQREQNLLNTLRKQNSGYPYASSGYAFINKK